MPELLSIYKRLFRNILLLSSLGMLIILWSCAKDNDNVSRGGNGGELELTIFHVNDMHGQLDNFAKIKHIVDEAKLETNVMLVSGGDIFSGNPIVDQYEDRGFPIIDIMNQTGFDITVIGNHEFDYGQSTLEARINQAEFDWVCANVNSNASGNLSQPEPYKTLDIGGVKVTVLGLVETNGKPDDIIPSTHPWRVIDLEFQTYTSVVDQYSSLKEEEGADVYLALTHLGRFSDLNLANSFPYFDVIIGGHTNHLTTNDENGIPTLMAGRNLSHLGRIDMVIENGEIISHEATLIDLSSYDEEDADLAAAIQEYNDAPEFAEVVGFSSSYHTRNELGCFYTTALKEYMDVDLSFQNGGGIRADIDEGDITALEIYNMDPFNNGSVIFTMTVREIKDFFIETGAGLHFSGVTFERDGNDINIRNEQGIILSNAENLRIGINDFIPAVYDNHFIFSEAEVQELTTAEVLIEYLKTVNSTMEFDGCNQFFVY